MQSTYVTWTKVCKHHNIPQDDWKLNGQYNYIEFKNGSRIDLLDLKYLPSDPLYERFGSLEYTDGAIEEAGEVNFLAYDVLRSRIGRHLSNKVRPTLLITGNPKKNWTYIYFYKPWKEGTIPDNVAFIQALYSDNQYTAEEYGKQLAQIKDKMTKERLMLGNWEYDDDPALMINYKALTDLFTNTVPDSPDNYITADIARYGSDRTVIMIWNGLTVHQIIVREKQGINQTIEEIRILARDNRIPYSHIIADEDGVGGGVVDALTGIEGFVNNSTPVELEDRQNFSNLKSQCYYLLAEYINNHKIAVRCEDEAIKALLIEELEVLKRKDPDSDEKLKIISKEDIKQLISRSPDISDALMMRMFFELEPIFKEDYIVQEVNYNRGKIQSCE